MRAEEQLLPALLGKGIPKKILVLVKM